LGDIAFYTVGFPIFELLTKIELNWADHYVACGTTGFKDYVRFSKMSPAKTTIIPNGIDLDKINSLLDSFRKREDTSTSDYFVIFTCGRLYASKGTEYLIKAMPKVLARHKNAKLKIFGKGPLHSHLQSLITSLKLRDHVELAGHVPYDRLMYEMSKSDLAVFPSLVEVGASLAVMEAMACCKAVIAFDYPFSNEIIKHEEDGCLVSPKNQDALAEAICVLLSDEKLRKCVGENARRNIVENHDIKRIVNKYIEVYSQVLSNSD
jgi:glycosyltransferase involved in cell wall biosynthesis